MLKNYASTKQNIFLWNHTWNTMAKIIMQFFIKKCLYNSCLWDAYISNDALTGGGALVGEGGALQETMGGIWWYG